MLHVNARHVLGHADIRIVKKYSGQLSPNYMVDSLLRSAISNSAGHEMFRLNVD